MPEKPAPLTPLPTRRDAVRLALLGSLASGSSVCLAAQVAARPKKAVGALTIDDVIANHIRASGGAEAFDRIHSMAADTWITENASTIVGKYKCTNDPYFRIDIYAGGKHVFCEGLDADGQWIWPEGEPAAKQGVPDAKRTALEGIEFNIYGLHSFASRGHHLALVGREELQSVNYYVIQVDLKDSYRTFLYIDPNTWMIGRRRGVRSFHPDMETTKKDYETQFNDFRLVSGIRTPFIDHQVDLSTGDIRQMSAIKSKIYNPVIDPEVMSRTYRSA